MKCVARKFVRMNLDNIKVAHINQTKRSPRREILSFLRWAIEIDSTTGLQAYRLLSGFMHRRLVNKISEALTVTIDDSMVLGSQRFFPSDLKGEGAVFDRELLYGKFNRRRYFLSFIDICIARM